MPKYTIDGKEATIEELQEHFREIEAKKYLAERERPEIQCFRGVPLAKFSREELYKIIDCWDESLRKSCKRW